MDYIAPPKLEPSTPTVHLLAYTESPLDLSVASARTCYSPGLVFSHQVRQKPRMRDRIAASIFAGGHHTPFQHPTFVFGIENVSRHAVWSFLHSHPFYNSEQSSQRYNLLDKAKVFVPPLDGRAREIYCEAVVKAWEAYGRLVRILAARFLPVMNNIGRIKGQNERKIGSEAEKKALEAARYVIPIAACTSLFHTISAIELYRYVRMMSSGDTPHENSLVVNAMVGAVRGIDAGLLDRLMVRPMERGDMLEECGVRPSCEQRCVQSRNSGELDSRLDGKLSVLIAYSENAEEIIADSVRQVVGLSREQLTDSAAIDLLVNPAKNRHLLDTLNTWHHSPLMRCLYHANYTFLKKLSHSGDSQDQRHRVVPGSRPLLTAIHTYEPDYLVPRAVSESEEALDIYVEAMRCLWEAKNRLVDMGVPVEFALYLLPNATAVRFTESGNLLGLMHKWRMRTCFLAQEEIYQASMDELVAVKKVHPRLARYLGPPCVVRNGLVEPRPLEGPCPEGDRYCGIQVWRRFPRIRRPF